MLYIYVRTRTTSRHDTNVASVDYMKYTMVVLDAISADHTNQNMTTLRKYKGKVMQCVSNNNLYKKSTLRKRHEKR